MRIRVSLETATSIAKKIIIGKNIFIILIKINYPNYYIITISFTQKNIFKVL